MEIKRAFCFWHKKEIDWLRYACLWSLCKTNPGLKIDLYLSEHSNLKSEWETPEIQPFSLNGIPNYWNRIEDLPINIKCWKHPWKLRNMNPIHRSDMFRWYMLHKEGGIYFDVDVLFLKPIDSLFENQASVCNHNFVYTSVLQSQGNEPLFKEVYKWSLKNYTPEDYFSTNEAFFKKVEWKNRYPYVKNIPKHFFYSNEYAMCDNYEHAMPIRKNILGLHLFGGSPCARKSIESWNHENWKTKKSTITSILKRLDFPKKIRFEE